MNYKKIINKYEISESLGEYYYKYLCDEGIYNDDIFNAGLRKLKNGVPIQYVIGNVSFLGYKIFVNNLVLIPRFETELLVEKTIKRINKSFKKHLKVLDLGTGSGCIAISLAKELDCNVTAVDISDMALEVAKDNAKYNNVNINFINNNMLEGIIDKFDVIISNPPYISTDEDIMEIVRLNEPSMALYASDDGLYFYDLILRECSKNLNKKFLIAFEIGMTQGSRIKDMAYKYLHNIDVVIEKDYSDKDRFVFISSKFV